VLIKQSELYTPPFLYLPHLNGRELIRWEREEFIFSIPLLGLFLFVDPLSGNGSGQLNTCV